MFVGDVVQRQSRTALCPPTPAHLLRVVTARLVQRGPACSMTKKTEKPEPVPRSGLRSVRICQILRELALAQVLGLFRRFGSGRTRLTTTGKELAVRKRAAFAL